MLWSKLTQIKDLWSSVQNAPQKGVPSSSPGSDDTHTERGGEGEAAMKYSGRKTNLQVWTVNWKKGEKS